MSLDSQLLDHLLFLSRMELSENERKLILQDFERTLAMIDVMHAANCDSVPPLENPVSQTLELRADEQTEEVDREALQQMAPEVTNGLYRVPRVI